VRVNARWLDALPADLQALVRQSARDIFAEQRRDNRQRTDSALAELVKAGVTVHRLPNDEASRWFNTARPLFDEFSNKSAETRAMVGRILAAR
jgi:C4-dicarboxylate-binding protein DctP